MNHEPFMIKEHIQQQLFLQYFLEILTCPNAGVPDGAEEKGDKASNKGHIVSWEEHKSSTLCSEMVEWAKNKGIRHAI